MPKKKKKILGNPMNIFQFHTFDSLQDREKSEGSAIRDTYSYNKLSGW